MESWIEIQPLPDTRDLTRRVVEKAAWREIVRRRLGDDICIAYNENGAPILEEGHGYIGVSHTRGWVAVIWSPAPCAIDIELKTRKLSSAAVARYSITSIEDWCALEAVYKYKGLTGIAADHAQVRFLPHPELVIAVIQAVLP